MAARRGSSDGGPTHRHSIISGTVNTSIADAVAALTATKAISAKRLLHKLLITGVLTAMVTTHNYYRCRMPMLLLAASFILP